METIRSISKAYYDSAPEVKQQGDDFYEWMKSKCRGTIGESQFLEVTKDSRPLMSNHGFFQMLKEDKKRPTLSKNDVMTMFYIIRSGRPFCNLCGHFILEAYFTCLACHEAGSASYTICVACFKNKKYINRKCKHYRFIDCYSWLYSMQAQKSSAMGGAMTSQVQHKRSAPSSSSAIVVPRDPNQRSNNQRTRAIVPAPQRNLAVDMLGLVNAGLTTANLVFGLCSIL